MRRWERRLHTRETALSLNRLKQRRLLATDISASADANFNIKGKTRIKNIFSKKIGFSGFVQSVFKNRQDIRILRANVNISFPRTDGISRDQHPFDCSMRIVN